MRALIEPEGDPSLMLRLAVRAGGCSGFSYDMFFDTEIDDTDVVSENGGVRLAVDAESAAMLSGAVIDYKNQGLQGAGFAVNNPTVVAACGCGSSFQVREDADQQATAV